MEIFTKMMFGFGVFILTLFIAGLLVGFPIMWLWNWMIPSLFHLREIDFWEALGLYLLAGFLTRGNSSSSSK